MRFLHKTLAVAAKDLRSEFRTKDGLNAAAAFAAIIILLFSFTLDVTDSEQIYAFSGGLLWMVFAFAGALILNRSFVRELPNDCLDVLIASPVSPAALFLGKSIANFGLLLVIEALSLPLFGLLYNVRWARNPGWLALVILLGTWGMTVVGTVFSALTVNLRLRELMLPTLVYPMMIPILSASMHLTTLLVSNQPMAAADWFWIKLLIGFDIIFTSLAVALIDVVLVN